MDLFPSPEQTLLDDTAAGFVSRMSDRDHVRAIEGSEPGFDPALWSTMCDLGWADLKPLELALVADRLGQGPVPSPLVVTGALRNALPALRAHAAPDAVCTLAAVVPGAPTEWAGPHPVLDGGGIRATFLLVPYASRAATIVVATADGLAVVEPGAPGITITRHDAIGGDALYRVDLDGVRAEPVDGSLAAVGDHLAVAALAYAVGAAEGALALAVAHAKDRHQFGRPIGAFQAVAHRLADMRAEVDACRVLARRAAWALDRGAETDVAVGSALAYAKDALRRVAMHAHQVHGAIGFSTEHDLHLFTRRIKAFELTLGSSAWYQERLATAIGLR